MYPDTATFSLFEDNASEVDIPSTAAKQASDTPSKAKSSPSRSSTKRPSSPTTLTTPEKKPRKAPASDCATVATSPSSGTDWSKIDGWTLEKREAFMNRVIGQGVTAIGTAVLAEEFGLTKVNVNNAISAGKKGNLREKALKAARG